MHFLSFFKRFAKTYFFLFCALFIRRKKNYIGIGGWSGNHFNDNSKYLAIYLAANDPNVHLFWFGNPAIEKSVVTCLPNCTFVKKGSFSSYFTALRCRYFCYNQKIEADISDINVFFGSTRIWLDHGIPLKKWEKTGIDYSKKNFFHRFLLRLIFSPISMSYICVSSAENERLDLLSMDCKNATFIRGGYPRNDYLLHSDGQERIRVKKYFSSLFGFDSNKKIILYAPTYRRTGREIKSLLDLPEQIFSELVNVLKNNNSVLVEKAHYAACYQLKNHQSSEGVFFQVGQDLEVDFQELLLASDVLVGDYSGAILDFLLLDRPEILFAYDYSFYKEKDSGLFYDISEFSFGPVVYNPSDLPDAIQKVLTEIDLFERAREDGRKRFLTFENGKACEAITQVICGRHL